MKEIVVDIETTVQWVEDYDEDTEKIKEVIDNSPYNPNNKIVTVHWRKIEDGVIGEADRSVFYHNDYSISDRRDKLQAALDWADVFIAHNSKYDLGYLIEAGFRLPKIVRDTIIGEYILARGTDVALSLEETAKRREVEQKKLDITKDFFKKKIGYEKMPLPIVLEYGDADVLATAQIYLQQVEDFQQEENLTLNNIVELMNEMLWFILEIEKNGIKIDRERLSAIKKDYETEREQIIKDLTAIAKEVMGDEPFNLNSGPDLSKIVYSREVVYKERHKDIFNIGKDRFGNKQYPPYMTQSQFNTAVRTTTRIVHKKQAHHCELCHGKGRVWKFKKNGDHYKNDSPCPRCLGAGYTLTDTPPIAGLRLVPERPSDASVHGFAVSKTEMPRLLAQAQQAGKLKAVEFLTKKKRLNAINTYLNSFVAGIERWTRLDGLLHAGFNQTITATGRLSSSRPNFQNQPKEKKFPIRSCVISRFDGGSILEADFSGLEFRVAGELSRDKQIIKDIMDGKDIHRQTASIVYEKSADDVTKDERNEVKPHTFAPLYYAKGGNEPVHIKKYYSEFYTIYHGHQEWLWDQFDQVIATGKIRSPSGREYAFPGTRRLRGREISNSTKISNYKIQGFATGDIVPVACIRAFRRFKELNLKSLLILTVHDSILSDVYPGEEKVVFDTLHWAMAEVNTEIKSRWNYDMVVPLAIEAAIGKDWMNMSVIK